MIANIFAPSLSGNSWNLKFKRDLYDWEVNLLAPLVSKLEIVFISHSFPNKRVWTLESSGLFSCKSFFKALIPVQNLDLSFLAKRIWNQKIPPRVKAFLWLTVLNRINTMDVLQRTRPNMALFPQWCILCKNAIESSSHIFIHCKFTSTIWNYFFSKMGKMHVWPNDTRDFVN